jgi:hypothetical protein
MLLSITPSGQSLHELSLDFLNERITVRELIRERIHHEVKEFNRRQGERVFRGLVQPTDDHEFVIGPMTNVTFVKLVPLVGG